MSGDFRIVDAHQHLWGVQNPDRYPDDTPELLLEELERNRIGESWLNCCTYEDSPGKMRRGNRAVLEVMRRCPERIRAMGFVRLGDDGPERVRELKEAGFFGLKVIRPLGPYDSPAFDPIWRMAAELKMPVTFHTGELGSFKADFTPLDMMPERLFRIAVEFPELIMIAAHMGNTRCQDACSLAARHENVFLDCSGAFALKAMPRLYFDLLVYWSEARGKLLFGVDQLFRGIGAEVEHTRRFAAEVGLSPEECGAMWHGNAERVVALTR